ncbi:hypothetical protein [Vibrio ostreicida]
MFYLSDLLFHVIGLN